MTNIELVEEFYGTEEQESPEYIKQVEAEFLAAFCLGNIKQA